VKRNSKKYFTHFKKTFMNRKKIIFIITLIAILFVVMFRSSSQKTVEETEVPKQPMTVVAQSAKNSRSLLRKITLPAFVSSDQEVRITAKSSGTITLAPKNIGQYIEKGSPLALIEDTVFNNEEAKTAQIEQAQIAVTQTKTAYDLAKYTNEKIRQSKSATKLEKKQAETNKDIAKLQYQNAQSAFNNSINNHSLMSPLSGYVVQKAVSVGDSVTPGQLVAIISQSTALKVSFFVNQEERTSLKVGQKISATDSDQHIFSLTIRNIASTADVSTGKFLVEALPEKNTLLSGTILSVILETTLTPQDTAHFILPLGALTLGQNEQSLFIIENDHAQKVPISLITVFGEYAEISAQIKDESLIIIDGNKRINEGEAVMIRSEK